jgi:multidrug resistance efflux pump
VRRSLKLGAALALISAAAYALISAFSTVVSDNAVVAAYTVSLRAPIAGYLSGLHTTVGTQIAAGTVLARLDEPRVDDQRLVDLGNLLDRYRTERVAYEHERDELTQQREELLARAAARDRSETLYLNLEAAEAERQVRQREVARDYAHRDRDREEALGRTGDAPPAMVDKALAASDQADRDAEAALARLAYLRVQAEAADRGMLLENGSNDVPYSSQRADEIGVRLAEIEQQIGSLAAAEQETAARLNAEQHRIGLLRQAEIVAPSASMVWKLGASEGEHLAQGDEVAQLVNCHATFVVAAIAQDRFSDVAIGGTAQIRLSGEAFDRTGRVLSVTGEASLTNDRNLAASPVPQRTASAMARIELAPSADPANECLVGRTARVLLPTTPRNSFFAMLIRRFF